MLQSLVLITVTFKSSSVAFIFFLVLNFIYFIPSMLQVCYTNILCNLKTCSLGDVLHVGISVYIDVAFIQMYISFHNCYFVINV